LFFPNDSQLLRPVLTDSNLLQTVEFKAVDDDRRLSRRTDCKRVISIDYGLSKFHYHQST